MIFIDRPCPYRARCVPDCRSTAAAQAARSRISTAPSCAPAFC